MGWLRAGRVVAAGTGLAALVVGSGVAGPGAVPSGETQAGPGGSQVLEIVVIPVDVETPMDAEPASAVADASTVAAPSPVGQPAAQSAPSAPTTSAESDVVGGRISGQVGPAVVSAGYARDQENTAVTVAAGPGRGSRATTGDVAPPPSTSSAGLMARASRNLGDWGSLGAAVDADTTGNFSARAGFSLKVGNYSLQWTGQVDYDRETGTWNFARPTFARYTWENEAFFAPTLTIVVPNEYMDPVLEVTQPYVDQVVEMVEPYALPVWDQVEPLVGVVLDPVGAVLGVADEVSHIAAQQEEAEGYPLGFEGVPGLAPEDTQTVTDPAEDPTPTGFEGSPEVGPEAAGELSGPAEDATPTGFEGSPEVGPENAESMNGPATDLGDSPLGADDATADAGTDVDAATADTGFSDDSAGFGDEGGYGGDSSDGGYGGDSSDGGYGGDSGF